MRKMIALTVVLSVLSAAVGPALAETTLEKIARTETLTIGTRTGSPPFAYVNSKNEWVGFTIDLVEQLVLPAISQKVGKTVKLEKKESTPPTRIPLLSSGAVDLVAGTMTDTRARRDSVDFSITFFVTAPSSSSRRAARSRASRHRRQAHRRPAGLDEREDHPGEGAQGSAPRVPGPAGRVPGADPGTGGRLHQRRHPARRLEDEAPNPAQWEIVGDFFSYEPYGMAMRKNESDLSQRRQQRADGRHRVRQVLRDLRQVVRSEGRVAVSDERGVRRS
jgi:hypothetical protein